MKFSHIIRLLSSGSTRLITKRVDSRSCRLVFGDFSEKRVEQKSVAHDLLSGVESENKTLTAASAAYTRQAFADELKTDDDTRAAAKSTRNDITTVNAIGE